MCHLKQLVSAFVLILSVIGTASAQDSSNSNVNQTAALTITAAATGERVRITAPSSVVQMHVEVYAASGEKLFDQEIRGGNIFDWHLQDGQAQRLAPGAYVCVVTAKSVSGRITQKLGTVTVGEKSASVQAGSLQLSLQQTQAIGPVEADSSWTIAGENEPQTPTVIANDGTDGQMIRGRGALTFRIGNFFSGVDTEQMRLTEAGNLGIGTSTPQSKLDVAGAIRAERFLVVKPKLASGEKTAAATQTTEGADSVQPLIAGTGTQNQIAKWTDNSGTLGDSGITENGGNVGIGTTSPVERLDVNGSVNLANGYNLTWGGSYASGIPTMIGVSGAGAHIQFRPAGTTSGETMRIDSVGRVGIGTTSPSYNLSVVNSSGARIQASTSSSATSGMTMQADGTNNYLWGYGSVPLLFATNGAEKMRIISSGNVGIGTSNPMAKLDVAGDINTSTQYNIGGNRILSNLGANNLFAGVGAGNVNTGNANTFVGREAGSNNLGGFNNSFFGRAAGVSNTSGSNNSIIGTFAGLLNTEGGDNSFVGVGAGIFNTTGNNNSFFGRNAGQGNDTGSGNTIIGFGADVGAPNLTNATAIGAGAIVNSSSTTVIRGSSRIVLDASTVEVPFNLRAQTLFVSSSIGTVGGSVCYHDNPDGYSVIAKCVSSRRYKINIARLGSGLDLVRRLRPITFDWKEGGKHDLGLIAEDVAAIEPLLVTYDSKGQVEGVKYDRVGVLLVNAVQEQQAQIAQQQHTIETLQQQNAQMKVRNAETVARLVMLETVVKRITHHHRRNQRRRS